MSDDDAPSRRGRGRPRAAAGSARDAILSAAAAEFAEHGYDGTSLRGIARRAGVDAALVHHYFSGKPDLLAAAIDMPIRPDRALDVILAGPREEIGTAIVRFITTQVAEQHPERVVTFLRAATGGGVVGRLARAFVTREILPRLTRIAEGQDPELRAALAGTQIIGLLLGRYLLRLEPIVRATPEQLAARIGPVIQAHLFAPDA